jgi:hypothetical protein
MKQLWLGWILANAGTWGLSWKFHSETEKYTSTAKTKKGGRQEEKKEMRKGKREMKKNEKANVVISIMHAD